MSKAAELRLAPLKFLSLFTNNGGMGLAYLTWNAHAYSSTSFYRLQSLPSSTQDPSRGPCLQGWLVGGYSL